MIICALVWLLLPVVVAIVLLLTIAAFVVPIIGPLVGVVLAWNSRRWSTADKWIATGLLAVPM